MTFVHISLLALGGLFTAVPIVLHLAMRQQPKHQLFPAIQFLRQRQAANRRRIRLRQLSLLLLRCLIVLLLGLALARPSVQSARLGSWLVAGGFGLLLLVVVWLIAVAAANRRGWPLIAFLAVLSLGLVAGLVNSAWALLKERAPLLLGDRQAAVAAVLLIDTSPRMNYQYGNQSRLERAKEIAHWLLRQFPADSQVAVLDASSLSASFAVDLGAASAAVNALESTYLPQPLSRAIAEALRLLDESDKQRKELYIISDLTHSTWDGVGSSNTSKLLQAASDVTLQIVDVGVDRPIDTGLTDLQLSQSSLTPGSPVEVRVRVVRAGEAQQLALQLFMEVPTDARPVVLDGKPQMPQVVVRDRQLVSVPADGSQSAKFSLAALPSGTHHGYVELEGADGLQWNNRLDFTVHVRAPWSILVVDSPGSESYSLTERLAPQEFREQGRAKFVCTVVPVDQLADQRLADYDAVGILDPPPLSDVSWQLIMRYLQRGGGVAMFLGRNANSAAEFNSTAALQVLPAPIERRWRDPVGVALAPRDYDQPLLSVMRDIRTTVPWDALPIFEHWVAGALQENSRVLIDFSDNKPALLERQVGRGRVMMLTTPISDPDLAHRPPWNLLPTSLDSWAFMILIDRLFLSLVQSNDAPLNYLVGQSAQLPVDVQTSERFSLLTPETTWLELTSVNGQLQVPFTEYPGTYRLNVDPTTTRPRGFSVTLPVAESRLDRLDADQLQQALGLSQIQIARTEAEIVREIDQARIGKEFYPFLLPLLVVILALEYVTANRFYPESR
jgi:hypothetical protein